ncbi:MAG TPA: hypothetical protein PKK32_01765 [Candidatus Paceibacterota bacterium]|jgi:hypothetical protein|nr:hypothetical protein [Candidatus Paceibacterota bacterium]
MSKKIVTNITKQEYVIIDGETGKELTSEEFERLYSQPMPRRYQPDRAE